MYKIKSLCPKAQWLNVPKKKKKKRRGDVAHVRGTKNKIKPLTWATFNNPFPKKKAKKKQKNKTYKKRRNWNAGLAKKKEEEGEEAKKKKKKKKGIKASEYGDSGASNPLVFLLLSNFFFFASRFPFAGRNTPVFGRYDPIRPGSARVGTHRSRIGASRRESRNEKKKKTGRGSTRRQRRPPRVAASGCVGRGCGGHFAASVHPGHKHTNPKKLNPDLEGAIETEQRLYMSSQNHPPPLPNAMKNYEVQVPFSRI